MTQNLNHYEKILSRSHSNYLAQISIEMTDANNQINDVLSKLTALGTVLIPMNLVTGLWGMHSFCIRHLTLADMNATNRYERECPWTGYRELALVLRHSGLLACICTGRRLRNIPSLQQVVDWTGVMIAVSSLYHDSCRCSNTP